MPTTPATWRFASVTYAFPGPTITSTRGDGLGSVRERGDRLRAAHPVDLVHAAERARGEDHGMRPPAGPGRRADGELVHSRGARRDRAHHDGRGVGRPAARHVCGGAAHRQLDDLDALAVLERDIDRIAQLRLGHGAHVRDRLAQAAQDVRLEHRDAPRRPPRRGRAARRARARRGRTRAVKRRTAASPSRRTASTIARTSSSTARGARRERAHLCGRRVLPEARDAQLHDVSRTRATRSSIAVRLQLVRDGVRDQPRGRDEQLLELDQAVLAQRRAGVREVDDRVHHPGQRRELDRSLHLDDLGVAAGLGEVGGRGARVLRRDPRAAEPALRLARGCRRPRAPPRPCGTCRSRGRRARTRRAPTARSARPCRRCRGRRRRARRRWARRSGAS